jgi:hypothetical protein
MKVKRDSEDSNIMSHLADGEASQALDHFDLEFARDPRSVRPTLSMDDFQPYITNSSPCSCSPVFVIPYNLLPNKYVKYGFIFHALVILGPKE